MIAVDLSKEQVLDPNPRANHKINFKANLDTADNLRIDFVLEEAKESKLEFSQGTVKVLEICYRIISCLIKTDSIR